MSGVSGDMTDEERHLDEAGVERAVAEVRATMERTDSVLVQAPRNPLTSPFGPEKVDVPFMVRRVLGAYFGSSLPAGSTSTEPPKGDTE